MAEQRFGHRPALVDAAHHVLFRNLHVIEEGVAEGRCVTERQHGLDVDAGALEVNQNERDPRLLLRRGVRAHEAEDPVGVLCVRRPGLLSVDDEVVARILGSRPQRREIASGTGLGVPLAPELLGAQDLRKESPLLLIGSKADDQRADHRKTKHGKLRCTGKLHLLVEDEAPGGIPARAAHFLRPMRRNPTLLVENSVPVG